MPVSEQMQKLVVVLSDHECYARSKVPGNVTLTWVIENQSNVPWEKGCYIRNHSTEEAYVKPIAIKKQLKPGKKRTISFNCYLPSTLKSEKVVLFFQFEDSSGFIFGSPLIAILDLDQYLIPSSVD